MERGARGGRSRRRTSAAFVERLRACGPFALALSAAFLLGACKADVPPCFGVKPGDRIDVTVVDAYDGNSNYVQVGPVYDHCDFGFDLEKGQVLHVTVVGTASTDDVCTVGTIEVAPFGSWTWTPAATAPGQSPLILVGDFRASDGACTGPVQVVFVVHGQDPFAPSVPGQVPNVVLGRHFVGSGDAGCPASCIGNFVVNLQKVDGG